MNIPVIKVLLVEDSASDAGLLLEYLHEETTVSFAVTHAADLDAALRLLKQLKVDALLLDLSLPDSQGIETLNRVLTQSLQLPIIVLTGLNDEVIATEALRRGAQDYLVKGQINRQLMVRAIHYAIERKQAQYALQSEKERAQHYLDIVEVILVALNTREEVILINPKGCQLLGFRAEEIIGKNWFDLCVPPPLREEIRHEYQSILSGSASAAFLGKKPIMTSSGGHRWVAWRHALLTDPAGKVSGLLSSGEDVTDRQQAEERLQKSEEFNRSIIESSRDCIQVLDLQGRLLFMSPSGQQLMEIKDLGPVLGQSCEQFWKGAGPSIVAAALQRARQGHSATFSGYCPTFSGESKWWEVIISPIFGGDGQVERLLAVARDSTTRMRSEEALREARDELEIRVQERTAELVQINRALQAEITERCRAEEALRASSRLLDAFFQNTLTPLVILDRKFNFIRVNQAFAKACGKKADEFPGRRCFEFFSPDRQAIFTSAVISRKPCQGVEMSLLFKAHHEQDVTYWDWLLVPILEAHGEVHSLVFSLNDVTERRRAQETRAQLAALVESSDVGIFGVSHRAIITSWNRGAEQLFSYSQEEIVGHSAELLVPRDESPLLTRCVSRIMRGERLDPFETALMTKTGARIFVHLTLSPIHEQEGPVRGVSVVCRDVTEVKRLENEILQISEREQQRIGRDLHDGLNQQLAGIAYLTSVLHERFANEQHPAAGDLSRLSHFLNEAISHAHRLAHGLHPVEVENNGLMSALAKLAAGIKEIYGISCRFVCRYPVLIPDNSTATHLYRISQEAVRNAVRHGKASRVVVELSETDQSISLAIRDNGCGLAEDPAKSKGMGLKTMSYRARAIGGSLALRRAPAGGTIVFCVLPKAGLPH